MSLEIFWFLPTHGDGHYLGTTQGARAVDHGYLQQIAQAADRLGFGGVLIPTGRSCEDSWLVAASLIPVTQRLKFLVALRPGIISPTVAARQAATLDRLSNGRALFNLVTGGDPDELAGDGLHLSHAERYEASVEFTRIWRRVLEGETVDYAGKHIQVKGAKLLYPPLQQPRPPLYFGGRPGPRRRAGRVVPDLGRAAGGGCREDRPGTREGRPPGPPGALRDPPACDRPRDQ